PLHFTFSSFLVPVTDLRKATLNALVDLNLSQKASIDGVTAELNEKCSTLFALTDTLLLKGKEAIEKAIRAPTEEDRRWYLMKSMEFFTKTAAQKYLSEIVEMYSNVRFSKGILFAVRAGFNSITEEQATKYFKKIECTEEILQEGLRDERPALCNALLNSAINKIKEGELSSDVLLKIKSPYLEDYLDRLDRTSDRLDLCDLIWKYHFKNENYSIAALYLLRSSERKSPAIGLQKRIEYLSIASTMQSASKKSNDFPVVGHIKNYTSRLGTDAKERLSMAQRQTEVMAALSCAYSVQERASQQKAMVEETFTRLDTSLLSFEELFEICVVFGFSLLALKIANKGEIEDVRLMKELWEDALSGSYAQNIEILKSNPEIMKGAPIDLVFDILLRKKIEAPQEGENIGSALVSLGGSIMKIADMLDRKATSPEHANPRSKKIVLEQAIAFCQIHNLAEIARKLTSFKMSLGI
ncbi:nuclear pore complex protein Nup155, partial [Nematocida minor]|uniref:nuclear pore complex protein Nup155 n=1 Tax=Nematocida minor TaxID=1912983 RepID=UPI00221FC1BF